MASWTWSIPTTPGTSGTELLQVMIGVLVRRRAPFPPAERPEERVRGASTLPRACSHAIQQGEHRRALLLEGRSGSRVQLRRGRRSLGEREHVQDQVLERKHLERAL